MKNQKHCMRYLSLLALILAGCGNSGRNYSTLVPVSGQVTLDQKPAQHILIEMISDSGIKAQGKSDSTGNFLMEVPDYGQGVPPEIYKVMVLGSEQQELAPIYADTPVQIVEVVKDQPQVLKLELKSKPNPKLFSAATGGEK